MEEEKLKITVERDGKKLILEDYADLDILEHIELFRTILYWLTFNSELINEYLPIEEEFKEYDNTN